MKPNTQVAYAAAGVGCVSAAPRKCRRSGEGAASPNGHAGLSTEALAKAERVTLPGFCLMPFDTALSARAPYQCIRLEVPDIGKQVRPDFQCSEPMSKINLSKFYHIPVLPSNRQNRGRNSPDTIPNRVVPSCLKLRCFTK
jgi:hypothetical protein